MNTTHLSEEELQLVALAPADSKPEHLAHLQGCDDCKAKATNYQLLFSGLALLPECVVDNNLQMAVMDKIAGERTVSGWSGVSIGLVSGLTAAAIGALVWLNPQLFSLALRGLSANMTLLVLFSTLMIATFYSWLIYKKHVQQMQMLDKL